MGGKHNIKNKILTNNLDVELSILLQWRAVQVNLFLGSFMARNLETGSNIKEWSITVRPNQTKIIKEWSMSMTGEWLAVLPCDRF